MRKFPVLAATLACLLAVSQQLAQARETFIPKPDPWQGDGRTSGFYAWGEPIPTTPGKMLRSEMLSPVLGLANAGSQFRVLYSSTDGIDGKTPVAVSGLVFLPNGVPPDGGWPVLAWAHETAGMADICAPSWTGYSTRISAFLNAWLARGYAIVATDYQGLGTPGPHPYMAVRPGAYGVLDSIRAATRSFALNPAKLILAGFSQGAGAVFTAAALQGPYAPDLHILGTIMTGVSYTTSATAPTMRAETAALASYTLMYPLYLGLVAQQSNPALKAADLFSEQAMPLFDMTRRACTWQMVLEVLTSGLTRSESVKPGYDAALAAIMKLLEYPSLALPTPVFIGIGELDNDSPSRLQIDLAKNACAAGTTVEAHLYAGMTHDAAVARSLPDALRFADDLLTGKTVTPVCAPESE